MDVTRLDSITANQGGLFTRAQARACGFSARQIRHRIRVDVWRSIFGPTLAPAGTAITPALTDRAVQLAIRGGVLGGPSAARLWGIEVRDHGSYLFVGRHSANSRHPGVRLLRDELSPHDIELIDGVLLTTRARAVFDCLRLLTEQQAEELLDRALQRRWITIDGLVGRVRAFTGRRGAPRLVRLVRMAASGARSPGERLLIDLLIRAGISGWTANHPVADAAGHIGDGDVVFPKLRLVLELDGWAYHTTPDRFRSDRERQNRFVAAGWTVLRFTWHDVTNRPDYVIAAVKAMISRLSTHAH